MTQDVPSLPAVCTFNDNKSYRATPNALGIKGWSSVIVPHTGTTIRVVSVSAHGGFMQVLVNK